MRKREGIEPRYERLIVGADVFRPSLEKILPRQRGVEGLEWGFRLFGHPSSA
jgi:hypothetical protein